MEGIDTEGLSKAQKKKLKAKLKKQQQHLALPTQKQERDDSDRSSYETPRMDEFGIEEPEKPRSYSLPNLASNMTENRAQMTGQHPNDFQDENEPARWPFLLDRDFQNEIDVYFRQR